MLRFFLMFGLTAITAFGIEILPWVDTNLITPMLSAITDVAGALIRFFGGQADSARNVLRHPVNQFAIQISNGCSGIEAVILLFAAMVAYPTTWSYRAVGCALGLGAIMAVNMVRIVSLFYIGQFAPAWFDWAHLYAWELLILLDGVLIYFVWLRWMPRQGRTSI